MPYRDPDDKRAYDRRYYTAHRLRSRAHALARYHETKDLPLRRILYRLKRFPSFRALRRDIERITRVLAILNS